MGKRIKVAWLAPYPVMRLVEAGLVLTRAREQHPCSWIVNLSQALAGRHDVELHLFTETQLVPRDQVVEKNGIVYHVIRNAIPFTSRAWSPLFDVDARLGFVNIAPRLARCVRALHPDVVHAHGTEGVYALAGVKTGLPCVISIQGIISKTAQDISSRRFQWVARWEQNTIRRNPFFFCRTHFDLGFVRQINPGARIFNVPEAMNPAFFGDAWTDPGVNRVLFIGSGEKRKGLGVLLEAAIQIAPMLTDFMLDIVGAITVEQQRPLNHLLNHKALQGRVVLHGCKAAVEIASLHRQCRLFVLPSLYENSPNALAEALVSGMPVIAADVGGVASMFTDGESGLLVPANEPQVLALAIRRILCDTNLRNTLSASARRLGRHHWPAHVAEQTIQAYRMMLGEQESTINL